MLGNDTFKNDQEILAYFTRPERSLNHRAIAEIRTGAKYRRITPASNEALEKYLNNWPHVDPETGLHIFDNELLLKSREAMLSAVQVYNDPKSYFRSEIFIVNAVIAWTYLLHAYFSRIGVDYRYKRIDNRGVETVLKTRHGAEKYWMLEDCLLAAECPLEEGVKNNLRFLIQIRHEIEHQMTDRIDGYLSAKLQSCAINFNDAIITHFGSKVSLKECLSVAIQFSGIDLNQAKSFSLADNLPKNIEALIANFEGDLTQEQYDDPKYSFRVIYVPKLVNRKGVADSVIQFVSAESNEAAEINNVVLKQVPKTRYPSTKIVEIMVEEGFENFSITKHTQLWQARDAKDVNKGYGSQGDYKGTWVWYSSWLDVVREHCASNAAEYR